MQVALESFIYPDVLSDSAGWESLVKLVSAFSDTKIRSPSLLKPFLGRCKEATAGAAVSLLKQSSLSSP